MGLRTEEHTALKMSPPEAWINMEKSQKHTIKQKKGHSDVYETSYIKFGDRENTGRFYGEVCIKE